jgi:hypothetical protein
MSDASPIPTSTSAHAEQPQSSTVPASARSGRGRQLTARQEFTLVQLCEERNTGDRYAKKTKKFWCCVSDAFKHETGRPYSWQSCRRRITKLEEEGRIQHPPASSHTPFVPAEPSGVDLLATNPNPDSTIDETDHDNDGEDDDLPPVPFVRSNDPHTRYDCEKHALEFGVAGFLNEAVANFEKQLKVLSPAIIKDQDDLRNVHQAFDCFKEEFNKAVDRGKRG